MQSRRAVLFLFAVFSIILMVPCLWADSNVRMVRVSFAQGSVLIDQGHGNGFQRAVQNMPVTSSTRLRTGDDGLAEVEFENGSTLRLTGDTSVLFQPLQLTDKGDRISGVSILQGTIYVDVKRQKHDVFLLNIQHLHVGLDKNTHLRVTSENGEVDVAVMNGELTDPRTGLVIGKNQSFRVNTDTNAITDVADGVDEVATDAWDKERDKYNKNPQKYPTLANSSMAFAAMPIDNCGYTMMAGLAGVWMPNCMLGASPYLGYMGGLGFGYGYGYMDPMDAAYLYGYGYPYGYGYGYAGTPVGAPGVAGGPTMKPRPPRPHLRGMEQRNLPNTVVRLPGAQARAALTSNELHSIATGRMMPGAMLMSRMVGVNSARTMPTRGGAHWMSMASLGASRAPMMGASYRPGFGARGMQPAAFPAGSRFGRGGVRPSAPMRASMPMSSPMGASAPMGRPMGGASAPAPAGRPR